MPHQKFKDAMQGQPLRVAAMAAVFMPLLTGASFAQTTTDYSGTHLADQTSSTVSVMSELVDFASSAGGYVVAAIALFAGLKMMKSLMGYGKGTGASG